MTAPTTTLAAAPPRRPLVAAAVVFVLLVAGTGAATLVAQGFRQTSDQDSVLQPQAQLLTIHNDAGDVTLSPSVDDQVHVHTSIAHGIDPPELVADSTSRGVLLEAHCDDGLAIECTVDYTVAVPPSFAVRVETANGDVQVVGLTGGLALDVDAGDIGLIDLAGSLTVRSGSGDVNGHDLRSGTVSLDHGNGDVLLELVTAPNSVQVHVDRGDIQLDVPGEQRYRVATRASGDAEVAVLADPTSTRAISVTSDSGDVLVRPGRDFPFAVRVPRPPDAPQPPDPPQPPGPMVRPVLPG